jgi:alpha-galactosidase
MDLDMIRLTSKVLTEAERRTQLAMWVALKSPLIFSADVTKLTDKQLAFLKTPLLIRSHQSRQQNEGSWRPALQYSYSGLPPYTFEPTLPPDYWVDRNEGNDAYNWMVNWGEEKKNMTLDFRRLPRKLGRESELDEKPGSDGAFHKWQFFVYDAWKNKKLGCIDSRIEVEVEPHDTAVLVIAGRCDDEFIQRYIHDHEIGTEEMPI